MEGIIHLIKQKKPIGSPSEADIERAALANNGDANISNMYSYFTDLSLDAGPVFPFQDSLTYLRLTNTWALLLLSRLSKCSVTPDAGATMNLEASVPSNSTIGSSRC